VDIVLTTNGTHTFVDVVIVDLTCANLVSQAPYSQGMVTTIVAKAKVVSYRD
jgi:hypothetical protein